MARRRAGSRAANAEGMLPTASTKAIAGTQILHRVKGFDMVTSCLGLRCSLAYVVQRLHRRVDDRDRRHPSATPSSERELL